MRIALLFVVVVVSACRSAAPTVNYAGPGVASCSAGRAYGPPPAGSERPVTLVPVSTAATVETVPQTKTEPMDEPVAAKKKAGTKKKTESEEESEEESTDETEEAVAAAKKPAKKPAKKKKVKKKTGGKK